MVEERLNQNYRQMIIAIDEYAYIEDNFKIGHFFNWVFENKNSLNITFIITSQQNSLMDDFDIEVKMK